LEEEESKSKKGVSRKRQENEATEEFPYLLKRIFLGCEEKVSERESRH
jgi:hypothetical protein